MTVPITQVTVTASYLTPSGSAAVGTVSFAPDATVNTPGYLLATAVTVVLVDGALSVDLYSTDDPDWAAPGWTYRVHERINGARPRTYNIEVPSAAATLDLASVAPVVPVGEVTPYILATRIGAPLGVASLDADGQVPFSQLGNAPGGGGGAGDPSSTVTAETSYGASSNAGAASTYSRGDHTHGTPALGTSGSTAAAGNHTHSGTYDPAGTAASAVSAHAGASDPHGDRAFATSAVATHSAVATDVHGIADTSALALTSHNHTGTYQPLDTDLTTIAGLTATTDNMIQSVGSAWASRTPAQVKTALALNNLDNTSDAGKPVSTAQQTALDLKANLASPTFTGTPTLPTGTVATTQSAGNSTTAVATTAFVTTADNLKAPLASPTFTGTVAGITAAMVGAIASTLPDAKGDVLTATAADTPARLAVGANDTVLTADSSTATGLKWATPAGGSGTDYKVGAYPTTGRWYRAPSYGPVGANLTMVQNRLYLVPFRLAAGVTFDRIGADVATVGSAGAVIRLGIWASDAAGGLPGTLVLDAGTVQADTGTGSRAITISQALAAGVFWLGVVMQTASGVLLRATVEYDPLIPYFTGANAITGSEAAAAVYASGITGALASTPTLVDNDRGPLLSLRCA